MAAGDEKIDVFDQVLLKSRLTDAPMEFMFDGKPYAWQPGETRAIPRAYHAHFLNKATFEWDPTEQNYPKRTLVVVDAKGVAADAALGATAEPLTAADAEVLTLLDDSNLPATHFDPDTGAPMKRKEGRVVGVEHRHFRGRGVSTPARSRPEPRPGWQDDQTSALDVAADAAAQAQT